MSKQRAAKIASSPDASKHRGKKSGSGGDSSQGGDQPMTTRPNYTDLDAATQPVSQEDLADEMGMESFPGSDPPSTWAGPDPSEPRVRPVERGAPRDEGSTTMTNSKQGNPDTEDQDAQPPGNGITTPLDDPGGATSDTRDGPETSAAAEPGTSPVSDEE
jgi:hypothetical protein